MKKFRTYKLLAPVSALCLLLCGVLLLSSANAITFNPVLTQTFSGSPAIPALSSAYVTRDATDTFNTSTYGDKMFMQAPLANVGENTREFIWPTAAKASLNQQSCATWLGASADFVQEGIALRITNTNGVTKGITVTKNIIYGVQWAFNVHAWDSSNGGTLVGLGQWDMSKVVLNEVGNYQYMPWRVCFRAINNVVTMKIWFPAQMSEPSWTDPNYAKSMTIPTTYSVPGVAGWYVGHIQPNNNAEYNGLATWSINNIPCNSTGYSCPLPK